MAVLDDIRQIQAGDKVWFNIGLIGGTPNIIEGEVQSVDRRGLAEIQTSQGQFFYRDLVALRRAVPA